MASYLRQAGLTLGIVALVSLTTPALLSAPPVKVPDAAENGTGAFMRAKLASSQKILEGLTSKKFGLIKDGAKELQKMSDAAGWKRSNDAVYLHYSREFRRLCEKLGRLAEDRNLEAASFTYMHMVSTCISCHEHSRDVLHIADQHQQQPAGGIRLLGGTPE